MWNTCRRVFKVGIKQKTYVDYNWKDTVESKEMASPIYVAELDKYSILINILVLKEGKGT